MNIELLNKNILQDWLSQFINNDKNKAIALLEDVNFVDQLDYDIYTSNLVRKIIDLSEKFDNIYLIPINSLNGGDEPKSDSSFAFNIKKKLPANIQPIWDFKNVIKRKSIIFFLDEFIGSGNTFVANIKSTKEDTLKRIRSLYSYQQIEVHVASIVIYKKAISLLHSNFKFINSYIFEVEGTSFPKKKYKLFLEKYITKNKCKKFLYGYNKDNDPYKGILSNIVFYNNCPNNTPSILWCKQSNTKPTPLFLGKKVHLQYKIAYYKEKQKYQRVLKHLDKSSTEIKILKDFIKHENYSLVVDSLIFLIKRKSMKIKKFQFYSNINNHKLQTIVQCCNQYGLINTIRTNGKITTNGELIINKLIDIYDIFYNKSSKKEVSIECKGTLLYYPMQIKGIKPNV